MVTEGEFSNQLGAAIAQNIITLPTLPEVALRIRDAVEKDSSTAHRIAEMVATDAALSARLLQVANSPLYRHKSLPWSCIHELKWSPETLCFEQRNYRFYNAQNSLATVPRCPSL